MKGRGGKRCTEDAGASGEMKPCGELREVVLRDHLPLDKTNAWLFSFVN